MPNKHFLSALALATSMAASASACPAPILRVRADSGAPVTAYRPSAPGNLAAQAPSAAGSSVKTIVSVLTDASRSQTVETVFAISVDSPTPRLYEAELSGSNYVMNVEPGTYDIVAFLTSDNEGTQIILFNEDVSITAQKSVLLNQRTAKIETEIRHTAPTGEKLSVEASGGNSSISDFLLILRHNDHGTVLQMENAAFRDICGRIAVNVIPKRFSITRMDAYAWEQGPAFMVIPVDLERESNGPDGDSAGWASAQADFAETPLSSAYSLTQDEPEFAMTGYLVMNSGTCSAFVGMGNYNRAFPTDRAHYWMPEGYGGGYEFYPLLRDNLIISPDASVSSMPYKMTPDGLVPTGLNMHCDVGLALDMGQIPAQGHPRFQDAPAQGEALGNAVPALISLPTQSTGVWNKGFSYSFTGRYGEDLGINSYNFSEDLAPSFIESIGGYRREVSVRRDGLEICTAPGDFKSWMDWGSGELYEASIRMSNVTIDGEKEGTNICELAYLASDGHIPTVTSLRFRDAEDGTADRFDRPEGACVELTAATFRHTGDRRQPYSFKAPKGVKLEYAPHATDSFRELKTVEVAENFFLPGYGTFFTAHLDEVSAESADRWYDLRVTVEGESGARQTQVLSPAFRIEDVTPAGTDSPGVTPEYGPCDVYSTDGRLVARGVENASAAGVEPGIYIEKRAGKTTKVMIP